MRALRRHRSTARLQVRCAAGALTALLLGCGAADAAGPYRPFQTGLWSGGAYTDDRSGKFSHCSVGVVYEGGTSLFVVSTEARGWWLGLTNPQWSLIPGAVVPVRLQFDTRAPIDLSGSAADAQLLLVAMPDDSHLIDTFRRTTKLSFVAQDRSFSLQLGGAARIDVLRSRCRRSRQTAPRGHFSAGACRLRHTRHHVAPSPQLAVSLLRDQSLRVLRWRSRRSGWRGISSWRRGYRTLA
jgi:hypothetical protein